MASISAHSYWLDHPRGLRSVDLPSAIIDLGLEDVDGPFTSSVTVMFDLDAGVHLDECRSRPTPVHQDSTGHAHSYSRVRQIAPRLHRRFALRGLQIGWVSARSTTYLVTALNGTIRSHR